MDHELYENKLMGSVRNCMFLLPLYEILVPGMELPVNLVTRAVMESVEAADDETVHKMRLAPQKYQTVCPCGSNKNIIRKTSHVMILYILNFHSHIYLIL